MHSFAFGHIIPYFDFLHNKSVVLFWELFFASSTFSSQMPFCNFNSLTFRKRCFSRIVHKKHRLLKKLQTPRIFAWFYIFQQSSAAPAAYIFRFNSSVPATEWVNSRYSSPSASDCWLLPSDPFPQRESDWPAKWSAALYRISLPAPSPPLQNRHPRRPY